MAVGDRVLVKQTRQNKLSPMFKPYPYRMIGQNSTMLTAKHVSTNHENNRNQTHFKSIPETAIVPKQEQVEHELEEDLKKSCFDKNCCCFFFCFRGKMSWRKKITWFAHINITASCKYQVFVLWSVHYKDSRNLNSCVFMQHYTHCLWWKPKIYIEAQPKCLKQ